MNTQLINIIFGMKVKQARLDTGMTLTEFASQAELSPSYVTEIEKGRKYPRADKIMRIAEVLHKDYDDLVSIRLEPPLTHLGTALSSPVLGQFPFEEFGIEMSDIVGLLTRSPDKASALLHAVSEVGRQYDLQEHHFLWSALRSYQELHDNYFPDLEDAAANFAKEYELNKDGQVTDDALRNILEKKYNYILDQDRLKDDAELQQYRSVFIRGNKPRLLLNTKLHAYQIRFLLAREIGYVALKLTDRANTTPPNQVDSFQQVLNDFRASYFASVLLMPRPQMLEDIQAFFDREEWSPDMLKAMMDKYRVTPENLMYRFSELIPQFFGLPIHYLRVHREGDRYRLVRQLNLNRLRVPNGLAADEHFCRHWLVVRLLTELQEKRASGDSTDMNSPVIGVQVSEYLDQKAWFFCFGFAREMPLEGVDSCGIIGFRIEPNLRNTLRFSGDVNVPQVTINETCERCSLTAAQCTLRAAPPRVLENNKLKDSRRKALQELVAEMRS
ncbi:MAG: transcriptional regulator with XRE-family HTH domain [Cellvibrionaceae bacterium]|jgi:transcriptional regulator with XRE-family HTH domain